LANEPVEPAEPVWVREDVVLAIHRRQLAEHGGSEGVRDAGLLASALARPRNLLAYGAQDAEDPAAPPDLAALAASYAFGIARNHPSVDGNKRVAFVVARTFLLLNGVDLAASQEDKCVTFLRLAEGRLREQELAAWIRAHLANAPE
jgi:death-on-curing protein